MAYMKRRRTRSDRAIEHIDRLGTWTDVLLEPIFGKTGERVSFAQVFLRQDYKRALEGNPKAIKTMMQLLEAASKRQRARPGWRDDRPSFKIEKSSKAPDNQDFGLLLLGIGAVSSRDLERMPQRNEPGYESFIKGLRVTQLEGWVLEFAETNPDQFERSANYEQVSAQINVANRRDCAQWYAKRKRILADRVRITAPKDTRFKPGVSGNPKGRPTRFRGGLPMDDYLMKPVNFTQGGKTYRMTRIEALLRQVLAMAAKDEKIARIIMPFVVRLQKEEWLTASIEPIRFVRC